MLTGTALLTKVTEMRSQEPPIKTTDIVRACGYESEKDFAKQYTTDVYGLDVPSFVVIDWEATWDQLSYHYEFVNGYVFSSNW